MDRKVPDVFPAGWIGLMGKKRRKVKIVPVTLQANAERPDRSYTANLKKGILIPQS
jgi:hypothetical protein